MKSNFFDEYKWKEFKWISTMQCSTFKQLQQCFLAVLLAVTLTITRLSSLDKQEDPATLSFSIIFLGHHTLIVWLYIPLLKNYWLDWIKVNIKKSQSPQISLMPYNYGSQNNDWQAWRGLSVEFCINKELGQKVSLKIEPK